MAVYDNKVLTGAGLETLIGLVKQNSGGGSPLPGYPSSSGNYQLVLQIDNAGNETLSWTTLTGAWQYPLQINNNLALYQGASIYQYNNNLEVV